MPTMVVEIHVPLLPTPSLPEGAYPFPWIEEIEDFLSDLEGRGDVEVFDDGEQHEDAYVFFVAGAGEEELLAVAARVATLPGSPRALSRSSVTTRPRSSGWGDTWRFRCPRPESP
ncbi:hypothetical protein ACR6C2_18590 [Streptomyces sp. INA 01156]